MWAAPCPFPIQPCTSAPLGCTDLFHSSLWACVTIWGAGRSCTAQEPNLDGAHPLTHSLSLLPITPLSSPLSFLLSRSFFNILILHFFLSLFLLSPHSALNSSPSILSLSLFVSLSPFLCLSISISLSPSSLSLSLSSLCVYLSLCACFFLCLCVSLPLSVSFSLCLCLSVCLTSMNSLLSETVRMSDCQGHMGNIHIRVSTHAPAGQSLVKNEICESFS